MEQFISSVKNGSKYDAVPFVKNNPIELSRLGRLVPGSQSRRPWVREYGTSEIFANGTAYLGHFG